MQRIWDKVGMTLSFICIIHCLALPFILITLPALKAYTDNESFHTAMVFLVTLTAGVAFIPGYLRHKDKGLMVKVIVALLLIVGGIILGHEFGELTERVITALGSAFLIYCHYKNIRHKGHCNNCEHDEKKLTS
jgi:hypothetical protein